MHFSLHRNFLTESLISYQNIVGNAVTFDVILGGLADLDFANDVIKFLKPQSPGFITLSEHDFSKNNDNGTTTIEDGFDERGIYRTTLLSNNLTELMLAYNILKGIEGLNKIVYKKNDHFYLEGFIVLQKNIAKPNYYAEFLNYKQLGYFINTFNGNEFQILATFLELYFNEGSDTYDLLTWLNNNNQEKLNYYEFYVQKQNGHVVIGTDAYKESRRPDRINITWYVILSTDQLKNLIRQWCVLAQQNIPHIILCKDDNEYVFEVPQQPDSIEEFKTYVVPLTSEELTKKFAQFRYFYELNKHTCIKVTSDLCYALVLFFQKMPVDNFFEDFLQWLNNGAQERYEIQYFGYITQEKPGLLKIRYHTDIICSIENFITIAQQWHKASTKKIPLITLEFKDGSFILSNC